MQKKKIFSWRFFIIHLIICELIFLPIFAMILIYHGPFTNLKYTIVSTAMGTNKNKYFATLFLSTEEINKILSITNSTVKDATQNIDEIQIQKNAAPTPAQGVNTTVVKIEDISGQNFHGKMMIISDPSKITLKLAPKIGEIGAPLSEFIKAYNAVGGVNAGGFQDDNYLGTGAVPDGVAIEDGEIKYVQKDLSKFSVIGFNKDNVLIVSNAMSLDEIKKSNLRCTVSFGPALIINGQPLVVSSGVTLQPRTAIGQKKDGTVILLVIDGRQSMSKGANYLDVQNIMLQYGAVNAANLDGGSSTTMNYQGKTINNPCDITGERSIASAFLILP